MELYRKVRLACAEGMNARTAAKHFGISRDSVKKMAELLGAARLQPDGGGQETEARRVYFCPRSLVDRGSGAEPQAAAHGQAGVRAFVR